MNTNTRTPVDIQDIVTRQYDAAVIRMLESLKIRKVNGVAIKESPNLKDCRNCYRQLADAWWLEDNHLIGFEFEGDPFLWTVLSKQECTYDDAIWIYGPKDKVLDYLHRRIYPAYEAPGL